MKLLSQIGNIKKSAKWGFFIFLIALHGFCTAACTVSGSLTFGQYNPFSSAFNDSSGSISVQCGVNLTIQVGVSTGQSGQFTQRYMNNTVMPEQKMIYNLYADANRTTVFGDGSSNSYSYSSLILLATTIPIYGRALGGQYLAPGMYTDNLFITMTF